MATITMGVDEYELMQRNIKQSKQRETELSETITKLQDARNVTKVIKTESTDYMLVNNERSNVWVALWEYLHLKPIPPMPFDFNPDEFTSIFFRIVKTQSASVDDVKIVRLNDVISDILVGGNDLKASSNHERDKELSQLRIENTCLRNENAYLRNDNRRFSETVANLKRDIIYNDQTHADTIDRIFKAIETGGKFRNRETTTSIRYNINRGDGK